MNLNGMPKADLQAHNVVVPGTGIYPSLSTAYFIEHYGIASELVNKTSLLVEQLKLAQATINQALDKSLTTGELTEQQSRYYNYAVYSKAKANCLISRLSSTHRDNATAQEQLAIDNYNHWQSESNNAMRLVCDLSPNLTVELL